GRGSRPAGGGHPGARRGAGADRQRPVSGAGDRVLMVSISSGNGVPAVARAVAVMQAAGDTLDAVVAGVMIVEDDPNDTSVGYGGLPNCDGVVELDACVMHG